MASSRISSVCLVVAGFLLLLSAGAHAGLGWPAMREELTKVSASTDLMASMGIGWYFGSVAMAAFGAIVLSAGLGAVTTGGRVFWASLIVGLAYGGFRPGDVRRLPGATLPRVCRHRPAGCRGQRPRAGPPREGVGADSDEDASFRG